MICVLLVVPGLFRAAVPGAFDNSLIPEQLPPVRAKDRDDYIRRFNPIYSAVEFLNRTKGDDYTLYTLAYSNMAYFADGRFLGDWFGPARHDDLLKHLSHPEELYQELHSLGANYFLLDQTGELTHWYVDTVLDPSFLQGHLKLIYAHSALLFEVEDQPVQMTAGPELLNNRGFEQLSDGTSAEWLAVGNPLIDSTGANSYESETAARSNDQNWLEQGIPVQSGSIYLLRHFTRPPPQPDQFARLQINWLDQEERTIEVDIRVVPAGTDWRSHAMAAIAPANASWAAIYASTHGDSEVWFDNFSFIEINYK